MNKIKNLINNKFTFITLVIFSSLFFTFFSGYRGIFPIDSFLIFDAGFKVLNNFYPFKDYWTITGPFLDYIQFLFFKIFGVSWLSYVLHAATINIALSLITFYFFCEIGLKRVYAFIYSISISILGYPSVGTPFMDHHATYFSFFALMYLILALKKNNFFYWFSIPMLLGFSFFSKQIPSVYLSFLFFVVIIAYLTIEKFKRINLIYYLSYGMILFIFICSLIIIVQKVPIKNVLVQYILYPISIGEARSSNLNLDFKNFFLQFKFIYLSLIPLIFPVYNLFRIKRKKNKNLIDILIFFTFVFSILIFIYSQLMTKNQILIFFLIPFCLGMSHYFIVNYFKSEKLIYVVIFIIIISTLKFHLRFNIDKKFMELSKADFKITIDGQILDSKLSGVKWITPSYQNNPRKELFLLQEVKDEIKKEKKIKIIVTDYQIMPSITETVNFAPNKWFDNLSVPNRNSIYFNTYKKFFEKKLIEQEIQVIFVIGQNKVEYLKNHFNEKNCMTKKKINEIALKLNIEQCIFND